MIGGENFKVDDAGVQFDRGRIQVKNSEGKTLLDIDQLPEVTVSQVVKANNNYGLWVLSKNGAPMPTNTSMLLENNTVAFSDSSGLLFAINPDQREINIINYPDHLGWFENLGRYRFWIWALAWLLLTLVVVHLYSMARQHKKLSHREKV